MSHSYTGALYHSVFSTKQRRKTIDPQLQEHLWPYLGGTANVEETRQYIANQKHHHRRRTFQEELIAFLEKHGIEFDPRTIWD